ncbi:MAG: ParA family protein [Gammaproteobacteria bacterium]|nr:ParA family protein [Gammaproteobacteria bacterium]
MAQIIAITNQKGGVGKTTTSINLASALAMTRRRVLLVDLDAQGNATTGSGIDKSQVQPTVSEVVLNGLPASEAIQKCHGYHLLPANSELTRTKILLAEIDGREFRLRDQLATLAETYEFVLIDCPPSLDMLTVNALVAANSILIPMQCEYFALEGVSDLIDTIETIRESVNPELRIEGLLRTMYDPRNRLTREVSAELQNHFGDLLYRTTVPRNVRLAEAPSHGLPITHYARKSRGAIAYLAMAGELLRRAELTPSPETVT